MNFHMSSDRQIPLTKATASGARMFCPVRNNQPIDMYRSAINKVCNGHGMISFLSYFCQQDTRRAFVWYEDAEECHVCRPSVKAADDTSNFDDYSSLPPIAHDHVLSKTEQAMFAGF